MMFGEVSEGATAADCEQHALAWRLLLTHVSVTRTLLRHAAVGPIEQELAVGLHDRSRQKTCMRGRMSCLVTTSAATPRSLQVSEHSVEGATLPCSKQRLAIGSCIHKTVTQWAPAGPPVDVHMRRPHLTGSRHSTAALLPWVTLASCLNGTSTPLLWGARQEACDAFGALGACCQAATHGAGALVVRVGAVRGQSSSTSALHVRGQRLQVG